MQLSTISLALTRLGGAFDPSQLFAGGTVAGAWYDPSDLTTLFTTSAGTTQCAMPGQGSAVSVGLMLDKSQGLVLGSELAGSILSSTSGWTFVGAATVSGGAVVFNTPPNTNASAQYNPIVSSGLWYRVQVTLTGTGQVNVQLGSSGTVATLVAPGSYTINGRASGGTPTVLTFSSVLSSFNNFVGSVTVISVRELPGNHAIAFNDTTARPELRARVNLLTYSEDQSNGAWISYSATQQSNVGTAPDGTNTADRIVEIAGSNLQARYQAIAGGLGISHTVSAYAKADQRNVFNLSYSGVGGSNWFAATFELTGNGSVTKTGAGAVGTYTSSSITPVGNGWYFCTVTGNPGQASTHYAYGGPSDTNNPTYGNFGVLTYSGNTANGVLVWGFDVRPANIGANVPAYQRIADANTYDTSGFPLYLRFDGIDDSMYTPANLNLSGTDKVSVFAGVRKLGTTLNMVTEFSSNVNNGTFYILGNNLSASDYGFSLRGTAQAVYLPTPYVAPISNVLAVSYDIAGAAIADEIVPRINGVIKQNNPSGSNAGTGNFGTYPLYIGSRNNAEFRFDGHLHSLIIAGSAVSAGNISATEQWVAGKTGITI